MDTQRGNVNRLQQRTAGFFFTTKIKPQQNVMSQSAFNSCTYPEGPKQAAGGVLTDRHKMARDVNGNKLASPIDANHKIIRAMSLSMTAVMSDTTSSNRR